MRVWIWALASALVVVGCKRSDSSSSQVSDLAVRAATAVMQGRLMADREGVVALPQNMQSASGDQKAYLKREADGTMWVLFPDAADSPTNFKGRLYCTKPPAEKPSKVQVVGPKAGGGGAPVEVTVDGGLSNGWYAVHAGA